MERLESFSSIHDRSRRWRRRPASAHSARASSNDGRGGDQQHSVRSTSVLAASSVRRRYQGVRTGPTDVAACLGVMQQSRSVDTGLPSSPSSSTVASLIRERASWGLSQAQTRSSLDSRVGGGRGCQSATSAIQNPHDPAVLSKRLLHKRAQQHQQKQKQRQQKQKQKTSLHETKTWLYRSKLLKTKPEEGNNNGGT